LENLMRILWMKSKSVNKNIKENESFA